MDNKYPMKFVGEIQKITLVSMPCFFCCPTISEGKWKKFKLFDEAAKHILNTIIEPFSEFLRKTK